MPHSASERWKPSKVILDRYYVYTQKQKRLLLKARQFITYQDSLINK